MMKLRHFKYLAHGLLACVGCVCFGNVRAEPTAEQQFLLELTNRMRANPSAELDLLVNLTVTGDWDSPKSDHLTVATALAFYHVSASALISQWGSLTPAAPLAWNDQLAATASTHSNVLVNADANAHNLDGMTLGQRLTAGGFTSQRLDSAESLFATASDVQHAHAAFAIDWGPDGGSGTGIQPGATHRDVLMDPLLKEIGIGFQTISIPLENTEVTGPLVVTQHFSSRYRSNGVNLVSDAILTGSIFDDSVLDDQFYTPGEGVEGTLVFVYNNATNQLVASGQTNSVGGYNITLTDLVEGTDYRVEAPDTGDDSQIFSITSRQENYGTLAAPVWVTLYNNVYASFTPVPEPGTLFLLFTALMASAYRRRSAF